MFSLDNN